jgi:hypothetical protein
MRELRNHDVRRRQDGVVYQQDLGEKTVELAQGMAQYDPGDDWKSAI